jgi:hypothetical protein
MVPWDKVHQPADLPGTGRIAPARGVARLGKEPTNQLIRHIQHRIGGVTFSRKLPQPLFGDAVGDLREQTDAAN